MNKNRRAAILIITVVATLLVIGIIGALFTGCGNKNVFDKTWSFERAIIFLPNGEKIEGEVSSWDEFDGSDMIQITVDGKTYLTHSSNVIMISE